MMAALAAFALFFFAVGFATGRFDGHAYAGVVAAFIAGAMLAGLVAVVCCAKDFMALDRDREKVCGEHVQEWTL